MTRNILFITLIAPLSVAGCMTSTAYTGGEPPLIATNVDRTFGNQPGPIDGKAAVAVTPDGCQAWIIDEGVEGYASTRSDPKSGLPVCTDAIAPGSVIGDHTVSNDLPDYLP